jgi:ADP-heptose:LPS heptosyltransferase
VVRNACGALALTELPELLKRLVAYLGVDSGITYMADAVGTPLVSVAGPCNMRETRPLGERVAIVQIHPPCSPCAHIFRAPYLCATGDFACIRDISAGRILDAIDQVLGARGAAGISDRGQP